MEDEEVDEGSETQESIINYKLFKAFFWIIFGYLISRFDPFYTVNIS